MARYKFKAVPQMLAAIEAAGVGGRVLSPGGAANKLGVTRATVNNWTRRDVLNCWVCGRIVLVDPVRLREVRWITK